jgi:hypothetical protein
MLPAERRFSAERGIMIFLALTAHLRSIGYAVGSVLCVALYGISLFAQPTENLTARDIDAAIKLGTDGNPTAYLLHYRSPDPAKVNPVILGAVYTPFLRVALAAKAAHRTGQAFGASDVPSDLSQPVFYVAVRWYCCDRDHGDDLATFHPFVPFDYKLAIPGQDKFTDSFSRLSKLNLEKPLWIKRDLSLLSQIDVELPYQDFVLVAAYPMSALAADKDFIVYRDSTEDGRPRRDIRNGRITADDVARWR